MKHTKLSLSFFPALNSASDHLRKDVGLPLRQWSNAAPRPFEAFLFHLRHR